MNLPRHLHGETSLFRLLLFVKFRLRVGISFFRNLCTTDFFFLLIPANLVLAYETELYLKILYVLKM